MSPTPCCPSVQHAAAAREAASSPLPSPEEGPGEDGTTALVLVTGQDPGDSDAGGPASRHGVLLYYCIAPLEGRRGADVSGAAAGEGATGEGAEEPSEVEEVCAWMRRHSERLNLVGRIRLSPQGLNVTVAGPWSSLQSHIALVSADPRFCNCDFKLAECSWPPPPLLAKECGLDRLTVRIVDELVTLGGGRKADLACAGPHLSPEEFHNLLLQKPHPRSTNTNTSASTSVVSPAEKTPPLPTSVGRSSPAAAAYSSPCDEGRVSGEPGGEGEVVLLDARNVYETRIGRFVPPPGVRFLDLAIRQFSDLPAWIDQHEDELSGRTILMYCTGGVRCEGASAYIRSKGPAFSRAFQLSGGICRYLEAFTDGGLFKGKNFVFDHRLAVGPAHKADSAAPPMLAAGVEECKGGTQTKSGIGSQEGIIGQCLLCSALTDDYSSRSRCQSCRMLVLLCRSCLQSPTPQERICELCLNKGSPKAGAFSK